jgi:hypothetical protein
MTLLQLGLTLPVQLPWCHLQLPLSLAGLVVVLVMILGQLPLALAMLLAAPMLLVLALLLMMVRVQAKDQTGERPDVAVPRSLVHAVQQRQSPILILMCWQCRLR